MSRLHIQDAINLILSSFFGIFFQLIGFLRVGLYARHVNDPPSKIPTREEHGRHVTYAMSSQSKCRQCRCHMHDTFNQLAVSSFNLSRVVFTLVDRFLYACHQPRN